jgi:hypothetical protein
MTTNKTKSIRNLLMAAACFLALAVPAFSQDFRVTEVVLKADRFDNSGACPVTVNFSGYITANGPGKVKYTFTRNDGATSPVQVLKFTAAGTQPVSTTWQLGSASILPRYEGWQAIKVIAPNEMESSHETGRFTVRCAGAESFRVTEAVLKADRGTIEESCPVTVQFNGYIRANGPGIVKYTFTRSDGATGPIFTLEFREAGLQWVSTTWTLGDRNLLAKYQGWQAIKVLSPNALESNHETGGFRFSCKVASERTAYFKPRISQAVK